MMNRYLQGCRGPSPQRVYLCAGGVAVLTFIAVVYTHSSYIHQTTTRPVYARCNVEMTRAQMTLAAAVSETHQMSNKSVQTYLNIFHASQESDSDRKSIESNMCVPLSTTVGKTPICIYDPKIDLHVSGSIVKTGEWEKTYLEVMEMFMKIHPNMQLLDIGCNIGVFTLQAAKMGRKVLAVDANKFNLRLLSKSLSLGKLEDVTLVYNAISDEHETIELTITTGNIGGSYMSRLRPGVTAKPEYTTNNVTAITLEDLLMLVNDTPLFIKMDIEGSEWKALSGGKRFFQEADVKYILMEWMQVQNACEMIQYFYGFGFRPSDVSSPILSDLNVNEFETWPTDVLWIRK